MTRRLPRPVMSAQDIMLQAIGAFGSEPGTAQVDLTVDQRQQGVYQLVGTETATLAFDEDEARAAIAKLANVDRLPADAQVKRIR